MSHSSMWELRNLRANASLGDGLWRQVSNMFATDKSWSHRWVSTLTSMSLLISFTTCFGIPRPASTESTTSSLGPATAQVRQCHPSIRVSWIFCSRGLQVKQPAAGMKASRIRGRPTTANDSQPKNHPKPKICSAALIIGLTCVNQFLVASEWLLPS